MQKFRQTFQRFFLLTAFVIAALMTAACGDDSDSGDKPAGSTSKTSTVNFDDSYNSGDTWVIQWYLCGTDLETNYGSATADIQEVLKVKLPPNVKFIIQTGGTQQWQNDVVNSGAVERYLYDSNGLQRLQTLSDADMGDVNTLTDFIRFGKDNYQADHRVFVLWDHGGGSVSGICFDERTNNSLSLNDLTAAFGAVYGADTNNPPFEIIGFDACLMATYDTINALDGFTRYVVASEEVEPGCGWNYVGWLGELANNPAMGGSKLGKIICDTYIADCAEYDVDDTATLSVIDMSKLPELRDAYDRFGLEALVAAYKDPKKFFSKFGRSASQAENYGGNNKSDGYTNMVDLADLARGTKGVLTFTPDQLISAIDSAVVYKVHGEYRDRGGGISGYYLYNGDQNNLLGYVNLDSASDSNKLLYYYLSSGELPDEVKPTLAELANDPNAFATPEPAPEPIQPAPVTPPTQTQNIFDVSQLEDTPVDLDGNGNSFVTLTQDQMDLLSSVHCQLLYISPADDIMLFLGTDADIDADWDTGVFKDNFRGVWPMLDGHPVYVEIVEEGDKYNLYSIPVKLNGVECNLQVVYVYAAQEYYILGAKKGLDNNGMSDRELIKLKPGDEITTLHYGMTISGDDSDLVQVEVETFTVGEHPTVKDEQLGDGTYYYAFEFISPTDDNTALSKLVQFDIKNGEITTTVDNS